MGEDDVAPAGEDDAATPPSCDWCGAFVDPTDWTPILTEHEDGELVIREFCDEECRAAYREE